MRQSGTDGIYVSPVCYNTHMNNIDATWNKWDYVCPYCDSHIEMTIKSNGHPHSEVCPKCFQPLALMSVVDATIESSTTKKEETNMETLSSQIRTEIELTLGNEITDLKNQLSSITENLSNKQNAWYLKESKLRNLLEEVYADSEEQETLAQIAEIFDVPLTKEIEVTAWIRVDMTIEVDMADGDYDIEDFVSSNLTVDSYSGEISVNNHEIERVEEGAY